MEQRYDDNPGEELDQFDNDAPEEEVDEQEPQEPQLVRIRLNGKTLLVTEEVADAIHEREVEQQRVISRQGQELGTLRRQPQEAPQQAAELTQDEDLEFFTSPSKAMAKRLAEAEERAFQRIQADQQVQENRRQFWGKFYSDHKDLADQEEVIQFIVNKHRDELGELPPAECHRELARLAKAFLGRTPAGKALPNRPAQSERASNPTPPARRQPEAPANPQRKLVGLSAELAARAEAKRKARFNIPKDSD